MPEFPATDFLLKKRRWNTSFPRLPDYCMLMKFMAKSVKVCQGLDSERTEGGEDEGSEGQKRGQTEST